MIDEYFRRIGFSGERRATLSVLDALHRAHVASIPFENLDVLLGRGVDLSLDAVHDKLVRRRRGGYCFEHVTLFAHVLAELGFSFRILGARVHAGATLAVPPRTHALVLLDLEGRTWFADPGFGGLGPRGVLPFVEGQPVRTGDSAHRLVRREQRWFLQNEHEGAFVDLHSFTLDTFETIDLEVANHYTATHPRSRFKNALVVQRHVDRGRVTLRDRELVVREDGKVERQVVRDRRELLEVLRDRFALDVPEVASAALPSY